MNLEINNALTLICNTYNINFEKLKKFVENNNDDDNNDDNNDDKNDDNNVTYDENSEHNNKILLPYYGVYDESKCKGLIYNHGLYTQCNIKHSNICSKCLTNKYGSIRDRLNYDIGKYVTPSGKKEIDYNIIIKRFNYNITDVIIEFKKYDIDINKFNIKQENNCKKKSRGRPKKIKTLEEEQETIEVVKYIYNNKEYLKTKDNILLDINTYDIVGIVNNNTKIEIW